MKLSNSHLATVLVCCNPLFLLYSCVACSESLILLLTVAYAYFHLTMQPAKACLVMFAAALTHYTCWIMIPLVPIAGLKSKSKTILAAYFAGAAAVVLWGYLNFTITGSPFNFINTLNEITANIRKANVFPVGYEALFPILYSVAFAFPFVFMQKRKFDFTFLFSISTVAFTVAGVLVKSNLPWARYILPTLPFLIINGTSSKIAKKHLIAYYFMSTVALIDHVSRSITFSTLNMY
ncbi:MAG: hypothetical protein NWF09_08870 [Candidatus Bathyarchaeota archaeon]|nr:hypothetical protein [Candidatus Bathyarchaeota archaeon]